MELPVDFHEQAHFRCDGPSRLTSGPFLRHCVVLFFFLFLGAAFLSAQESTPKAQTDPLPNFMGEVMTQKHLFGESALRSGLAEEKGISFDFHYIGDFLADPKATAGHQNVVEDWGRLRGTMDIDFGKLAHLNGLTFHITGMWQNGTFMSGVTGALADASGIESFPGLRLDSFWFQQALFKNKVYLRAGQFAGQDYYGVQQYGGAHIIEPLDYAFGILGNAYESFDPFSSPAAEVRVVPTPTLYFKTAVLSGNHDFNQKDRNGFHFNTNNHAVIVDEVGYLFQPGSSLDHKTYPGAYRVGAAWNGDHFPTYGSGAVPTGQLSSNHVIYFQVNQAVYRAQVGSNRGLDAEFGLATSPEDRNAKNTQFTGGLVYNGLIPHRGKDSVAFGIVHTKVSSLFATPSSCITTCFRGAESAYEVSYRTQVTPWLAWQPVVQIYSNVGAAHQGSAVVTGFRTFVDF
jgi:porin